MMSCLDETAAMPANRPVKSNGTLEPEETGRVLRFEPRRGPNWPRPLTRPPGAGGAPAQDIEPYDAGDGDDYRHRMRANLAALAVVALLICCGYWLFNALAEWRNTEDCILSGRTNCARIDVPPAR